MSPANTPMQCKGALAHVCQVPAELEVRSKFGRTKWEGCKYGGRSALGLKALWGVPGFASPMCFGPASQGLDHMVIISPAPPLAKAEPHFW